MKMDVGTNFLSCFEKRENVHQKCIVKCLHNIHSQFLRRMFKTIDPMLITKILKNSYLHKSQENLTLLKRS
jgi:hypothetical protein